MHPLRPYVEEVVREFYVNLHKGISDPGDPQAFKPYVRGHLFDFSPAAINEYLMSYRDPTKEFVPDYNVIMSEITGKKKKKWPRASEFPASILTLKYGILHKITIRNWLPSLHKTNIRKAMAELLYTVGTATLFDLGRLLFDQIISQAEPTAI